MLSDFLHPSQNEASKLKIILIALKIVRVTTSLSVLVSERHSYGLWLGSQGQFVDIVARVSKADTDMTVDGYKTGSMDSMAYSLSGEFGWRFALSDMVYIEPQVEAAYTYVDADDADIGTASYKFDSVNSFIGRAGFATGIKCPSNFGDVYFHALH